VSGIQGRAAATLQVTAPPKIRAIPKERKRPERVQTVKPIHYTEKIRVRCAEIEPRHLSLGQLERDDCRYPFGDGPFTFCGRLNMDGKSYCPDHFQLTITPNRTNSEAVTEARARRMRGINFRKALLEGMA